MFINRLKTVILLSMLSGLFMLFGSLLGGSAGVIFAFIMSVAINFFMYFYSETIVLKLYKAQPLDRQKYNWVYSMVQELTEKMGMPMPKLWLIPTDMANAFATGRSPKHASVAFTSSIMKLLEPHELRGVIAHELSHVKNRDVLVATLAATMATTIGYLASFAKYSLYWSSNNDRRQNSGIGIFIAAILMPLASTLIQLAISRSREYLADESGAHACHDPLALASALEKLQHSTHQHPMSSQDTVHASTASLFIVHPFKAENIMALFSTHPPMAQRIERLRRLADIIHN